jgi:hypothetical protein
MRYLPVAAIILMLLLPASLQGQYYQTGQDPASLRWLQVKTGKFRIIYPEKYGKAGLDYAMSLMQAESDLSGMFPSKKFRIPVVIHNFSTASNGYVAWAPRRIEIYPTPEQNAIPGDQFRLLSIHELTHVHQLKSLSRGFTALMSVFLGEQATGITAALLPLWYLEGNAVLTETALTNSGRGRSPAFQKQLKAIALDRGNYRYDKILNGSYLDFVPNHYESGYQMVAWAMAMHDTSIWKKVLRYTGNYPFTLNPVNLSLSGTGLSKRSLYKETFDSLRNIWSGDLPPDTRTYERINPVRKERYVSYHSPVFAGRDSIVAVRTSLSSTTAIVLVNPSAGFEKVLHRPGRIYPYLVSYGGGKVVWVENRPDPRWNNRDYSVIMSMDIRSGRTTRLSYRTRYLAASVSPDGSTVSAVENTPGNTNRLVFLDAETGEMLYSIPTPSNSYIQNPQWSENGKEVTVIHLDGEGEGVMSYSTGTNSWKTLIPPGDSDLQAAFLRNDSLFYVSSHSGTENIYVKTGDATKQITRSVFGAINPDLRGRQMIFSDYTVRGNSISMTSIDEASELQNDDNDRSFLINRLDAVSNPSITPEIALPDPVRYRKTFNLFRFHSWMPLYADLDVIQSDPLAVRPGFTIMSQNTLSTLITTLGYEYSEDGKHVLHSKLTWQGRYPVFESKVDYGYLRRDFDGQPMITPGLLVSNQVYIPLRFSTGHFTQYLRPSLSAEYKNSVLSMGEGKYDFEQWTFTGRFFFSNSSRVAMRDIYPKWAQSFDLNYVFSPFDRDLLGTTTYIKTAFYFPGFFSDNGIKLKFEAEKQNPSRFIYPNRASFPRGFNNIGTPGGYGNIISNELLFASADYVFPVAYPDFSIPELLYLKRIRTGFFYDFAAGTGNRYFRVTENGSSQSFTEGREYFTSYGVELLADFHVLRIPFEISGGIQAAWRPGDEMPVFKVLFNVDLYGFSLGGKQRR